MTISKFVFLRACYKQAYVVKYSTEYQSVMNLYQNHAEKLTGFHATSIISIIKAMGLYFNHNLIMKPSNTNINQN